MQQQQLQQQQHLCLNQKNLTLNKNFALALPLRRIPFTEKKGEVSRVYMQSESIAALNPGCATHFSSNSLISGEICVLSF